MSIRARVQWFAPERLHVAAPRAGAESRVGFVWTSFRVHSCASYRGASQIANTLKNFFEIGEAKLERLNCKRLNFFGVLMTVTYNGSHIIIKVPPLPRAFRHRQHLGKHNRLVA